MITLKEAVEIAKEHLGDNIASSASEYADRYVFECKISMPGVSASVMKSDGSIGAFFPPDFDYNYLNSRKKINISKYL